MRREFPKRNDDILILIEITHPYSCVALMQKRCKEIPPSLLNAHLETHSRRNLKQRSAIFRKLLEKQQKRRFFGIFFHFSLKEILENLKGLYQTSFKTRTFFHRKNANSINYFKECRSSLYQNTSFDTFGRNKKWFISS